MDTTQLTWWDLAARLDARTRLHSHRVADTLVDPLDRVTALLHDVVEDGVATLAEVRAAAGDEVAEAVDVLTRRSTETYAEYLDRVLLHDRARRVKRADVRDNLSDRATLKPSLEKRYRRALELL